ncbi:MAG: MFS transporter [Coxiella sp. DG_40]|nr:MAG: MFS transporter [Coxiella sp. DG_40]
MMHVYNFSSGPATLPQEVLEQAQAELLSYQNLGLSAMEISHRSTEFEEMLKKTELNLRELLSIPKNYYVLFLQGGARTQFAMVPMNILRGKQSADYIKCGIWSKLAMDEAKAYCKVNVVASSEANNYTTIPPVATWRLNSDAAYLHYTPNETINGVEFPFIPDSSRVPLVADMSSTILSQPLDVNKFGLIYACAQKNIAPSGLTIVIIRDDLITEPMPGTPTMLNYKNHIEYGSIYNTPPIFCIYMAGLMFQWLKKQGGLKVIAERNQNKAEKLYRYIDQSDFYINNVDKTYRSRMNVPFTLCKPNLTDKFVDEAKQNGLHNLKGHPRVGGLRASIYNSMPEHGVDALIEFMKEFANSHG